jgi:arylsulfatase A-like enzyme
VSLIDIFPTVLEAAGIAPPAGHDAHSLLARISGEDCERAEPVVSTWKRGNHSVRTLRWRYTRYSDGGEELFDHGVDPFEWTNLAARAEFAAVREDLARRLEALIERRPAP